MHMLAQASPSCFSSPVHYSSSLWLSSDSDDQIAGAPCCINYARSAILSACLRGLARPCPGWCFRILGAQKGQSHHGESRGAESRRPRSLRGHGSGELRGERRLFWRPLGRLRPRHHRHHGCSSAVQRSAVMTQGETDKGVCHVGCKGGPGTCAAHGAEVGVSVGIMGGILTAIFSASKADLRTTEDRPIALKDVFVNLNSGEMR